VIEDDARIVWFECGKEYADDGRVGVEVQVEALEG
jgi:Holliday junction resolvase RusA-like endonuclease